MENYIWAKLELKDQSTAAKICPQILMQCSNSSANLLVSLFFHFSLFTSFQQQRHTHVGLEIYSLVSNLHKDFKNIIRYNKKSTIIHHCSAVQTPLGDESQTKKTAFSSRYYNCLVPATWAASMQCISMGVTMCTLCWHYSLLCLIGTKNKYCPAATALASPSVSTADLKREWSSMSNWLNMPEQMSISF